MPTPPAAARCGDDGNEIAKLSPKPEPVVELLAASEADDEWFGNLITVDFVLVIADPLLVL